MYEIQLGTFNENIYYFKVKSVLGGAKVLVRSYLLCVSDCVIVSMLLSEL